MSGDEGREEEKQGGGEVVEELKDDDLGEDAEGSEVCERAWPWRTAFARHRPAGWDGWDASCIMRSL